MNFPAHWWISSLDAVFTFLTMKVEVPIISGIFRVNRNLIFYLKLLCNFCWNMMESKSTCISFSYSSIPPVLKEFWPWCYAQHNLFITFIGNTIFSCPVVSKKRRMVGLYTFYLIFVLTKFLVTYNWNNQHIKGATKT